MKKIIMTIVAVLAFGTAMAQENVENARPGRGFRGMAPMTIEQRTDKMVKDYELNEEQAAKVKELNSKYESLWQRPNFGQRMDRNAPDSVKKANREQMREQMKTRFEEMRKNQTAYNEELKQILGDEKFEKYQKAQQKERQRMRNFGQGGMRPRGGFGQGGMRGGMPGGMDGGFGQGGNGGFDD
ncbi:MAG: DUF4890 domain-containing protein [Prevotellaceae bacterium]|nr:DUF4890 domain-containing protein [Prevotellaceae bacterium]